MSALLRYMLLKSWRDRSLIAFVFFTASSLFCGRIAVSLIEAIRRTEFGFAPNDELVAITAAGSTAMAALSGFWVLRVEIRDRSLAAMLLATRTSVIAGAGLTYTLIVGLTSFLITIPVLGLRVPPEIGTFGDLVLVAISSIAVAGSVGLTMASVSPEAPMVVPTWIASAAIVVAGFELPGGAVVFGSALAAGGVSMIATSLLLERRCAA